MPDNDQLRRGDGGGMFQGISQHLALVWRLLGDGRVSLLLKLLPLGSLVYLVSPFDLPTPIDDIGVIWGFTYLFIELCPPEVVAEHRLAIRNRAPTPDAEAPPGEVIDAEFREKE